MAYSSSPIDARPTSPSDEGMFPSSKIPHQATAGPPSIISSRMTDIASDDGEGDAPQQPSATNTERPGTAASSRAAFTGPVGRRTYVSPLTTKRNSATSTSASASGHAGSMTSRSHVPSLTSNAFFRPMSSQKLQAQRGGSRPTTTSQQVQPQHQLSSLDDNETDAGGSISPQNAAPNPPPQAQQRNTHEDNLRMPPSRGSEFTGNETFDHITSTTSPTQGHYPAGSLTDSVRPLHRNAEQSRSQGLRIDVNQSSRERPVMPIKSPRSFRSSFRMPGKSDQGQPSRNRSTEGAEKLSSGNSSPRLHRGRTHGGNEAQPGPRQEEEQKTPEVGRVFQYFEGNTRFCLGGRWQNTKQQPINIATGAFVVIPGVLFFVFEAPWLWHNISPAIPIMGAYLFYICFSSFIHASVSDPGILPRNLHQFPPAHDDDPLRVGPPTNDWMLIKSAESGTAAMEVPIKHCRTCNIWRPPRAHHCRVCDNCIEGHDHHCVWLNNCIGKRNYRYFFTFVTSGTILALYFIGTSLTQLLVYQSDQGGSFGEAIDHFRGTFAVFILSILGFCYPAALSGYHVFLMARGETTREYINSHKFVKGERYRAFSHGNVFVNWFSVLCRPRPPTYYGFKSKYSNGDQRLGLRRDKRPRSNSQGLEMQNVSPLPASGFQGPMALRGESQV